MLGIDADANLLKSAQQRGVSTMLLDAHALKATASQLGSFDAVLSNAALHWMAHLQQVIHGIHTVLVPGGRFVAEMGGQGNVNSIIEPLRQAMALRGLDVAACNPWVFPSTFQVIFAAHSLQLQQIRVLVQGCANARMQI